MLFLKTYTDELLAVECYPPGAVYLNDVESRRKQPRKSERLLGSLFVNRGLNR